MRTYVIEREIPGAGQFSPADLQAISQKSCSVLDRLGTGVQWVHSYVTQDKIYCVYRAGSVDLVRRHAEEGGFPANSIAEVLSVIDPSTAEPPRATAA
jgi:hypothetical protein